MKIILIILLSVISLTGFTQSRNPKNKAVFLEDISWTKAKELLTAEAVVVIPLDILFVKDEKGEVTRAWCQSRGENIWVAKSN